MKHTITQEDIDNKKPFVTEDSKVGDQVEINTEQKENETDDSE